MLTDPQLACLLFASPALAFAVIWGVGHVLVRRIEG